MVLQCFLGIATLTKMSNMLRIAVDHEGAILNKLKSVRRKRGTAWDKVQRTRSQLMRRTDERLGFVVYL